jgi:hypothetical protein
MAGEPGDRRGIHGKGQGVTATSELTGELRKLVRELEDDLRLRVEQQPDVLVRWEAEHKAAVARDRTASTWSAWRDERVTQAAVAWVLTTVFIRFCEDNGLVGPVWIAGPESRRQEALDAQLAYFREHPEHTDREWIEQAITYFASHKATRPLVDEHAALRLVSPSGDAAASLLAFWRERGEDGRLLRDMHDPELSTRFLGDLYQDISESARSMYALLQTPVFVEEFILDQTLEPALAERPLDGFKLIDPACGSGHFLLGAFARLLDRWHRHAPGLEAQVRVQEALDAIHGVDINPFAVVIARFRLTLAAMQASGLTRLEEAPAFDYHVAAGDSLLHGQQQQALDFGSMDPDSLASGFAYSTEDLAQIREILKLWRYDVVVGNPPYITVKDAAANRRYRERYPSCKGTYALTVPFMERFFQLAAHATDARPAGWTGQITSNSFMKREFGAPLIERFLSKQDLRLVADTSGAYIPGHGTPTVIIVGRNQKPVGTTVRAVLGIRGEPGRADDPAKGIVWQSIVEHVDEPGHDDGWTGTTDLDRIVLNRHPWSLTGGGALDLGRRIASSATKLLGDVAFEIGRTTVVGEDDAWIYELAAVRSQRYASLPFRPFIVGEQVRDFVLTLATVVLNPYRDSANSIPVERDSPAVDHLWPLRSVLSARVVFEKTLAQRDLPWWAHLESYSSKLRSRLSIAFAFVATHNHFVLDRGGKVFNRSAPVIKLPEGASEDDHLTLLGVLNSSTACFWLKQTSHNKGSQGVNEGVKAESWERFYEFTGTTLERLPLPDSLPLERGRWLDSLAQRYAEHAPDAVTANSVPSRHALDTARAESERIRARMITQQEELDWEVYRLYGLIDDELTYGGEPPGLALGERAFEIALARKINAGEEETAWFERHGSTPITEIPEHWPADYRELVERRLNLIASHPSIRLLEKPEQKRRWAQEPWAKREERAVCNWLLDRLEDKRFWFDNQGRPIPRSIGHLADDVARDSDLMSVLALWEGRPDVPVTQSLTRLLADEAVPYLAAYRYKDSGLRKRADWEQTWALQRREDAGEKVGPIPVPPKYTSADFVKTAYWRHRGKLDVPKERFILYPDAGRATDPTRVLGWAGWDHAQQSLALSTLIGLREQEGWSEDQLIPLTAGLAELQSWVEQWHADIDPAFGVSLAAFCREQLIQRKQQVGKTDAELAAWRPAKAGTRRRAAAKASEPK